MWQIAAKAVKIY